mmetsp:Transcript_105317/g.278139  ORF Transcript_105317/g.278139 Transcript_105317/m.278139 type:complete len:327 (+) Transcript_105317:1530-2510(+)
MAWSVSRASSFVLVRSFPHSTRLSVPPATWGTCMFLPFSLEKSVQIFSFAFASSPALPTASAASLVSSRSAPSAVRGSPASFTACASISASATRLAISFRTFSALSWSSLRFSSASAMAFLVASMRMTVCMTLCSASSLSLVFMEPHVSSSWDKISSSSFLRGSRPSSVAPLTFWITLRMFIAAPCSLFLLADSSSAFFLSSSAFFFHSSCIWPIIVASASQPPPQSPPPLPPLFPLPLPPLSSLPFPLPLLSLPPLLLPLSLEKPLPKSLEPLLSLPPLGGDQGADQGCCCCACCAGCACCGADAGADDVAPMVIVVSMGPSHGT